MEMENKLRQKFVWAEKNSPEIELLSLSRSPFLGMSTFLGLIPDKKEEKERERVFFLVLWNLD